MRVLHSSQVSVSPPGDKSFFVNNACGCENPYTATITSIFPQSTGPTTTTTLQD